MDQLKEILLVPFLRPLIHYSLHLIFPLFIAYKWFNKPKGSWKKAYIILLCTMAIDLDHLLATPIFDPDRCSVGFHFLHSYVAIGLYCALLASSKFRVAAVGLLFHVLTDYIDCLWMRL